MRPFGHRGSARPRAPALALALALGLAAACATDDAAELDYAAGARVNYEKGKEALEDENFPEAVRYFTYVKNKYPFSKYAAYAELRIADSYFAEERYLEAIDGYKLFVRGHPTHPEVASGYVAFRVCEAYVHQMPDDWFLVPPAYERDQSAARDALRELRDFRERHAESRYRGRAEAHLQAVIRRLADYELYAARFYLGRDKPRAAAARLEGLLEAYPESRMDADVLLLLGQTYLRMGDGKRAEATFRRLIDRHGGPRGDSHARKAQLYLDFMREKGL